MLTKLRAYASWLFCRSRKPSTHGVALCAPCHRLVTLTDAQEQTRLQKESEGFRVYFCYTSALGTDVLVMTRPNNSTFDIIKIKPDGTY